MSPANFPPIIESYLYVLAESAAVVIACCTSVANSLEWRRNKERKKEKQ